MFRSSDELEKKKSVSMSTLLKEREMENSLAAR
jgi:hypothetical protein